MRVAPRCLRLLLVLCLSGIIVSCSTEHQVLRVGLNQWPGYETLVLARTQGYYGDAPIHIVELTSATEVMHALRTGALEVAALTLDETLSLLQSGVELKVILVTDISDGADVLMARPELSRLADLRGKRVGVENTALGAVMLDSALNIAHLDASEIEIVSMTVDKHLNAYQNGEVDAVVTFEPILTQLSAIGAVTLFDSSDIPGRILDVLVVRAEALETHSELLSSLISGHMKALDMLRTEQQRALELMAPRLGLTPSELGVAYTGLNMPGRQENMNMLDGHPSPLQQRALRLMELMRSKRLLFRKPDVSNLVTTAPLEAAKW